MFSSVRKKLNLERNNPIELSFSTTIISDNHYYYYKTIEDAGFYDGVRAYVFISTYGGGYMVESFSSCDECLSKYSCQFTTSKLCNPVYIQKLIERKNNAYLILCRYYKFSDEVIRAIENNSESNAVRLADILHRIYHKDPSITLANVGAIVYIATKCTIM